MRLRTTVRGEGIELRGYATVESMNELERLFADDLDERAVIIASIASDDYDPFRISQPDHEPTIISSTELIQSIWGSSKSPEDFLAMMASLHYQQAYVIRGERFRAEIAEIALGEIIEKAIAAVDETTLGASDFAQAARDSAKAALRQVAVDIAVDAGPPRG